MAEVVPEPGELLPKSPHQQSAAQPRASRLATERQAERGAKECEEPRAEAKVEAPLRAGGAWVTRGLRVGCTGDQHGRCTGESPGKVSGVVPAESGV